MFGLFRSSKAPRRSPAHNPNRARLTCESLEDRTLPSPVASVAAIQHALEGQQDATLRVTLSEPSSQPITVMFNLSGDAQPGSDYVPGPMSVFVAPFQTTADIIIDVTDPTTEDGIPELPEDVQCVLLPGPGYLVGPDNSDTVFIFDNDGAPEPPAPAPLPAIVVDTEDDSEIANDGLTSLREAITIANGPTNVDGRRITFAAAVADKVLTLNPAKGELSLDKKIHIEGPADNIVVQRDSDSAIKHRIFNIGATANVTLTRLALYEGNTDSSPGGIIRSYGDLTLRDCRLFKGQAENSLGGGVAALDKSLTVTDTIFDFNKATQGGAIYIAVRVKTTIIRGEIWGNEARLGAGVFVDSSTTPTPTRVVIFGTKIHHNQATDNGGGIFVSTAGAGAGTHLFLLAVEVYQNKALNENAPNGKGGGVYFGRGKLILGGVDMIQNTARKGTDIYRITGTTRIEVPFSSNSFEEEVGT